MARDVKDAIDKVLAELEKAPINDGRTKDALLKDLREMSHIYADLKIGKPFEEQKKSLLDYLTKVEKKASEGLETPSSQRAFIKSIKTLDRYLRASVQDFTGKSKSLRFLHISFIASSVIFFITWPLMINNVVVPILFFIPTIVGIMALRNRSRSALPLMFLCYIIHVLNGALWSRYALALLMGQVAEPGSWFYIVITVLGCIQIPLAAFSATLAVLLRDALV